jgi:polar amino acid transport system substrate-binding protein
MQRAYRKLVLALLGLACSLPVFAQKKPTMCPDRPIRFAHYEFGLVYSKGKGGIDDDFQQELAKRSGCAFEVVLQPRARTWVELERGTIDMAGTGIQTPARDKFAWFFPYVLEENVVILGARVPADMHNFEQFLADPTLKLAGVRSYRYSPYFDVYVDQLIALGRHTDVVDPEGLYRMFEKFRFDAFITNPLLYLAYVRGGLELPESTRIERWDPTGATPSSLVLSKSAFTESQAKEWQHLVESLVADGTVKNIVVKHMGPTLGPKSVYKYPAQATKKK